MTDPVSFTNTSARFKLPFLFAGQAQKEFVVNQTIAITDTLLHPAILSEETSPPAAPADGDSYIIGQGAVGLWSGRDRELTSYQAGIWVFIAPRDGMRVFDQSSQQLLCYNGSWLRPATPQLPLNGVTQDSELRQAFTDLIESLKDAGILAVT